jgi:hypothetical protein
MAMSGAVLPGHAAGEPLTAPSTAVRLVTNGEN